MEQWELELIGKVRDLARTGFAERSAEVDREGKFPRQPPLGDSLRCCRGLLGLGQP